MMEQSLTWRKSRLVRYAMTVVMLTVLLTVFGVQDGVMAAELPYDTIEDATGISIAEFETIVKNEIKIQNEGESTFVSEVDERHTKIKNYDLQNAYIEYDLANLIITKYKETSNFQSLMGEDYSVKIPCEMEDGIPASLVLIPENGTLVFAELGLYNETPSDTITYDSLEKLISETTLEGQIEQIRFTYANMYHMQLVYIVTSETEYIMPRMSEAYDGIQSNHFYQVDEFFQQMNQVFDESAIEPNLNGAVPYRKHFSDLIPIGIALIGFLGAVVCIILLVRKKHMDKKMNMA